jgi:tetratricopeptide (TPR) repeat protein
MAKMNQRLGLTRYEADEYYKLALEAYRKERFDEAINHMNDAIGMLPRKAEYYATRGYFYAEDGVKDKALADFDQALKLYPYEMLAHYGKGILAYRDKNYPEALTHFTSAYHSDPQRPETQYYLALTNHRLGNDAQAQQLMAMAAAGFEKADDKRKADANRWLREFQKALDAGPPQAKLPMPPEPPR